MKRNSSLVGVVLALVAVVFIPACNNAKDMQIAELQRQLDDCQGDLQDLESRYAAALNAGDQARQMALSLQQQLDECRRQLAAGTGIDEEMPPGWKGNSSFAWLDIGTDILFDSGKATLKGNATETLQQIANTIKTEFAGRKIFVVGHTDTDPIKVTKHLWSDNLDLSQARAATVAREFYKLGIDAQAVYAAGQGEYNPKAPNDTKTNKALNRRVEILAVQ